MSPRQVHAEVEALLDRPALWGSVTHALSSNITGCRDGTSRSTDFGESRATPEKDQLRPQLALIWWAPTPLCGIWPMPARVSSLLVGGSGLTRAAMPHDSLRACGDVSCWA